jgi:hypothetical protein
VPATAVRVSAITAASIARLAAWERLLADHAVDYDYAWTGAPERLAAPRYAVLLDGESAADLAAIPQTVLGRRPLTASPGHSVGLLLSRSPFQLLALVRNSAEHRLAPGYGDGVNENHRQHTRALPLSLSFGAVPNGVQYKVYDLDARRCCAAGTAGPGQVVDLGTTPMDAAVLVSERPLGEGW